jgi:serine phosphatase RsbU (regulator of sigma subunit)
MAGRRLAVAGASRPYPGEAANGDAWGVHWHDDRCRIAVVDGLGHGEPAAAAASLAIATLEAEPALGPEPALRACHAALTGSRGAVISIAQIDLATRSLIYAGVGNVEARLYQGGRSERPVGYRGFLGGAVVPRIRSFTLPLDTDWLLLLYTDGIRDRFELDSMPRTGPEALQAIADTLLAQWARPTDDATVVVASPS